MKVGTSVRAVALLLLPLALLAPGACAADVSTTEVAATPDVDPSVHAIKVNATDKILGGRAAGTGEFPAVVELSGMTSNGGLRHVCAGVLISMSWVLSAAHCTTLLPEGAHFYATIGRPDLKNTWEGEQITVSRVVTHPEWGKGFNDIALFRLERPATTGPMARSYSRDSVHGGQQVQVAGWGIRSPSEHRHLQWWNWWDKPVSASSTQLMVTNLQIVDEPTCQTFWDNQLQSHELCATDPSGGSAVCAGDSGGPLMANGQVVGITSFGKGNKCSTGGPAVFTSVGAFAGWIDSNLNRRLEEVEEEAQVEAVPSSSLRGAQP